MPFSFHRTELDAKAVIDKWKASTWRTSITCWWEIGVGWEQAWLIDWWWWRRWAWYINCYYDIEVTIESYVSFREGLGAEIYIDCSFLLSWVQWVISSVVMTLSRLSPRFCCSLALHWSLIHATIRVSSWPLQSVTPLDLLRSPWYIFPCPTKYRQTSIEVIAMQTPIHPHCS